MIVDKTIHEILLPYVQCAKEQVQRRVLFVR